MSYEMYLNDLRRSTELVCNAIQKSDRKSFVVSDIERDLSSQSQTVNRNQIVHVLDDLCSSGFLQDDTDNYVVVSEH